MKWNMNTILFCFCFSTCSRLLPNSFLLIFATVFEVQFRSSIDYGLFSTVHAAEGKFGKQHSQFCIYNSHILVCSPSTSSSLSLSRPLSKSKFWFFLFGVCSSNYARRMTVTMFPVFSKWPASHIITPEQNYSIVVFCVSDYQLIHHFYSVL